MISVSENAVGSLYIDYLGLQSELQTSPSGLSALNRSYHKHLLMAAASSLEHQVKQIVASIFEQRGNLSLATFVGKRVMARSYHTLFDWPNASAKGFFSSFGDSAANAFKEALARKDSTFKVDHDAFMAIGHLRNGLVHNDYANSSIELTPAEIIDKFKMAQRFVLNIEPLVCWGLDNDDSL